MDDAELLALGHAQERTDLEEGLAAEPPEGSAHFVCVHCDVAETSRAARAEHLRSVSVHSCSQFMSVLILLQT